jgi:hypothetical protein
LTEQQEDSKPEIVDQSPKYVFETAPTGPEGNLSSAGQMLIGGLVGFSPLFLMFVITAWGTNFNPTVFICGSTIFVLAGSAFAFTQQEGAWKPLGTSLLIGFFGGLVVLFGLVVFINLF